MAGGLILAIGKPKGGPMKGGKMADSKDEGASDEKLSSFDEYAADALEASQNGDEAAWKKALKGAIKACYESEEE